MHETISYARLIRLPNVLPLLGAICLTRLADRMFGIVIVFYALAAFGSPRLAGFLSFAAVVPGLLISPLAGALLDRAGAERGIVVIWPPAGHWLWHLPPPSTWAWPARRCCCCWPRFTH